MNDDPSYAEIIGVYDDEAEEVVLLDKCVERGLLTQEEYEEILRVNAEPELD